MEERESLRNRESFYTSLSKNLEDQTRIQYLKCENTFLEQEVVRKIGDKKDLEHYKGLIEKLRNCDEIMAGFETRNIALQNALQLREEELAQMNEDNEKLKFENSRLIRESDTDAQEIARLKAEIESMTRHNNENNCKNIRPTLETVKEKELTEVSEKLKRILTENEEIKLENSRIIKENENLQIFLEELKKKNEKGELKLKENQQNHSDLQQHIKDLRKEKVQHLEKLKLQDSELKQCKAKIFELHSANEDLCREKAKLEQGFNRLREKSQSPVASHKQELVTKLKTCEEDIMSLNEENQSLLVKLDFDNKEKSRLLERTKTLEEDQTRLSEENQDLQVRVDVLVSEKSKITERLRTCEKELETIKAKNMTLYNELCAKNVAKAQENQHLKSENEELKRRISNVEMLASAPERSIERSPTLSSLQEKNSLLQAALSKSEKEYLQLSKQNKKYSTERISKTQENLALKQEIEGLKSQLNGAESQITKLENKLAQVQGRLAAKEEEIFNTIEKYQEQLNCKNKQLEGYREKEKNELLLPIEKKKGMNFHKKRVSIDNSFLTEENCKSAVYFSCQNSFESPNRGDSVEEKKSNFKNII